MGELEPRKQALLHAIVLEYVRGAEPVASEVLVQKYPLGVRSATIRNEMAEMTDLGFLEQPHTSAGRVPSDRGYRYYVDRLIDRQEPSADSKHQLKDATEDGDALQALLRDTAKVLSKLTMHLSIATTVRNNSVAVRNVMLSALGPGKALLIVVLSNGQIENRMFDCQSGVSIEDVGMANEVLQASAGQKTLRALIRTKPGSSPNPNVNSLLSAAWSTLRTLSKELTRGLVITEGEEFMLAQPEFQRDVQALHLLLKTIHDNDQLHEALGTSNEDVEEVLIGKENRLSQMKQLSVVRHSFFVGSDEAGVIAIVAPTRTSYERTIPLVNFTARALSNTLTRFLG